MTNRSKSIVMASGRPRDLQAPEARPGQSSFDGRLGGVDNYVKGSGEAFLDAAADRQDVGGEVARWRTVSFSSVVGFLAGDRVL